MMKKRIRMVIVILTVKKIDKLIVMDNVSVLADKSNDFSNFLTPS